MSPHRMATQTYEQSDNECDIKTLKLCGQPAPNPPPPAPAAGLSSLSTSLQGVCCSAAPAGRPGSVLLSSSLKNKERNHFFFPTSYHLFPFYLTSTPWLLYLCIWPLWPLLTRSLWSSSHIVLCVVWSFSSFLWVPPHPPPNPLPAVGTKKCHLQVSLTMPRGPHSGQ